MDIKTIIDGFKSRERKYRIWIHDRMIELLDTGVQNYDFEDGYVISFVVDGYEEFWAHENYGERKDIPVMDYSGIKDENKKDVYEGDIVSFDDGMFCSKGIVFRSDGKIMIQWEGGLKGDLMTNLLFGHVTVIGNIFENPELFEPSGKEL